MRHEKNICERIKSEREEFHSLVKEKVKDYPKRLSRLTEAAEKYSTEKWKLKFQVIYKYPKMYSEISRIPMDTSAEYNVLFYPECLLKEQGTDFVFREYDLSRMKKIGHSDEMLNSAKNKRFTVSYPRVSDDLVAEELAVEHEVDVVISSSALKHIADNCAPFKRTWHIPVIIKEYNVGGDIAKKIVYVDKALPPTYLTAYERNLWYYKDHIRNQWNNVYEENLIEQVSNTQLDHGNLDCSPVAIHIPEPENMYDTASGQSMNSQTDLLDKIDSLCISELESTNYSALISSLEDLVFSDGSVVNKGFSECDMKNVFYSESYKEHSTGVINSESTVSESSNETNMNIEIKNSRKLNDKEEMRKKELLKCLQVTEKLRKQKDLNVTREACNYITGEENTYSMQCEGKNVENTLFNVTELDIESWKDELAIVDESDEDKLTIDENYDKKSVMSECEEQISNDSFLVNNLLSNKKKENFRIKTSAQTHSQLLLESRVPEQNMWVRNGKRKLTFAEDDNKIIAETGVKKNDHEGDNESNETHNNTLLGNSVKKCINYERKLKIQSDSEKSSKCFKDNEPQEGRKYNLRSKLKLLTPKDKPKFVEPSKTKRSGVKKTRTQIQMEKPESSVISNKKMKTEIEGNNNESISCNADTERQMFFNALCLNYVKAEKEEREADMECCSVTETNNLLVPDVEIKNEDNNLKPVFKSENESDVKIDNLKLLEKEKTEEINLKTEVFSDPECDSVPHVKDQHLFPKRVQYGLWKMSLYDNSNSIMMKNKLHNRVLTVLVRCKVDKFEDRRGNSKSIYMMPKMEYKSEFGAEYYTRNQLIRQNTAMFFRPLTDLLRVRVDTLKSEKVSYEHVPGPKILSQDKQLLFSGLKKIYKILNRLAALQPGTYMLVHSDRHEAFVCLMKADDGGTYDLYKTFDVDLWKTELIKECENPLIDHSAFLPWHYANRRIPCTFDPPTSQRASFGGRKYRTTSAHNTPEFNN